MTPEAVFEEEAIGAVLFDVGEPKPLPPPPPPEEPEPPKVEVADPTQTMIFDPPLAGAVFSECKTFRYLLWRRFKEERPDEKVIQFLGVNPSNANESDDDATVRRWISFAKREDAALMVVGNLIPYVATSQKDLRERHKWLGGGWKNEHGNFEPRMLTPSIELHSLLGECTGEAIRHRRNTREILKIAEVAEKVVVCWGNGGSLLQSEAPPKGFREISYGREMVEYFSKTLNKPLYCFGTTKSGEPRHPLRLSAKTPLVPFSYAPQPTKLVEEDFELPLTEEDF